MLTLLTDRLVLTAGWGTSAVAGFFAISGAEFAAWCAGFAAILAGVLTILKIDAAWNKRKQR